MKLNPPVKDEENQNTNNKVNIVKKEEKVVWQQQPTGRSPFLASVTQQLIFLLNSCK